MNQIAAIETRYRGYRFRSRLEARWAVFFENAGIKWSYEPQGYDLAGTYYLPDFHLRGIGFFEVKGINPGDYSTYQKLANATGESLFLAVGDIPNYEDNGGTIISIDPDMENGGYLVWGEGYMFLSCSVCGRCLILPDDYCTAKGYCFVRDACERGRMLPPKDPLNAARSARFEHGERG